MQNHRFPHQTQVVLSSPWYMRCWLQIRDSTGCQTEITARKSFQTDHLANSRLETPCFLNVSASDHVTTRPLASEMLFAPSRITIILLQTIYKIITSSRERWFGCFATSYICFSSFRNSSLLPRFHICWENVTIPGLKPCNTHPTSLSMNAFCERQRPSLISTLQPCNCKYFLYIYIYE